MSEVISNATSAVGETEKKKKIPELVIFTVPGQPVGKGRHKTARRGKFLTHYTPEKTANYESLVAHAAHVAMAGRSLIAGAVSLSLDLYATPPASWSKKKRNAALSGQIRPTTKPDFSNVLKAIEDGMNGVVYLDDKQIVNVSGSKNYSETPCAQVEVRLL